TVDLEKQETERVLEFKKQEIQQAKNDLELEKIKQIEMLDERKKQERQECQQKFEELKSKKKSLLQEKEQFKQQLEVSLNRQKELEKVVQRGKKIKQLI